MMDDREWETIWEVVSADSGKMLNQREQVSGAPSVVSISLLPVGVILRQNFSELVPSPVSHPPRPSPANSNTKRRKCGDTSYIKKPPNAFLIFMKEQRPFVKAAAPRQDSAAVNKVLGQMWKSLTPAEQLSYFQESERLSRIHATRYPDWTYRDNYGKKQKRKWGSAATSVNHLTAPAPQLAVPAPVPSTGSDEDLVSTILLGDTDFGGSALSLDVGPEVDLTAALYSQLEALEAEEAEQTL
ncbi:transcription factor SOX-18-like isoform X1 [Phyllopteryx taeniolatus]|uniref:transcription factor SOX-18-like isoform X1 n=1 Tax=Phyllopteryx taeniolatus TaxID=161469 RepID=UPI002AD49F1B|nr:transcription factor SOX-18-like isoform X1 [Phyllopteryx taeniolatus]